MVKLSYSQLRTWLRCPRQWALRYVEGIKVPPPGAAVVGQLAEKALGVALAPVIEGKKPEPLDVTLDVFHQGFKEAKDTADWRDDKPEQMEKGTDRTIRIYHNKIIPSLYPLSIQERREYTEGDIVLRGIADLREPDTIVDWKVSKRPLKLDRTLVTQLYTYSFLFGSRQSAIHNLPIGKEPIILPAQEPTPEALNQLWGLYVSVAYAIKWALQTGIFLPASLDHPWACKYCGYRDICQKRDWRSEPWLEKIAESGFEDDTEIEW